VGNPGIKCAVASALCVLLTASVSVGAQSPGDSPPPAPRTPWGHPDLQGRWTNSTLTPLERPAEAGDKEFFSEAEAAAYQTIALDVYLRQIGLAADNVVSREFADGIWMDDATILPSRRTSLITGPTGRLPPMTPEAQARVQSRAGPRKADGPEDRTLPERCLWFSIGGPPMLPFVYNSNYQIVQTPTHVGIVSEQAGSFRTIPIDGRPHLNAGLRQWQGDSRGRWEGDTLVVETTNFTDKRDVRGSTDRLRVVERFSRANDNTLLYQFTAEDASTWTAPWAAEVPMRRLNALLYENACHEGNYGLANILKGARFVEGLAAAQRSSAPTAVDLGRSFPLRIKGEVEVGGASLQIRFDRVSEDSRCPVGVTCIWEGDAVVRLTAVKDGAATTFDLHTNARFEREHVRDAYQIRLLALEPLPTADGAATPSDYVATLVVERTSP
jgi:hypothetical protein